MDAAEVLRRWEEQLLQTSVRKNAAMVSSLLSEEFCEFGSSGRMFTKAEVIRSLQAAWPASISTTDWQVQMLTEQIALVHYRCRKRDPQGSVAESLRTSIWTNQANQWKMLFHQGTKVPPESKRST
jgi:hypothetical protein